jgi:hypothetical protein
MSVQRNAVTILIFLSVCVGYGRWTANPHVLRCLIDG